MPHHTNGKTSVQNGKNVRPAPRSEVTRAAQARPAGAAERPAAPALPKVLTGCIGRGHAGKTALFRALTEGPVGDFFPSGLHLDVGDPREVARMIREAEETQRILWECGLPPTLEASEIRYYLFDGARPRAAFRLREVVGQVLTHTLPDSAPQLQARYVDYIKSLVNTHVLWVVVPCLPPGAGPRDCRRYANDLRIATAYLREALRVRPPGPPVAVALVLSKIDVLFADEAEARAALPGEALIDSLGPLADLIEQSDQVSDAVVLPVTAFGFGNAVPRQGEGGRDGAPAAADDPFGLEPVWLLKEGVSPRPFNLDALVLWSLFIGLCNQLRTPARAAKAEDVGLCQMVYDDLVTEDRWLIPLKGRLARP